MLQFRVNSRGSVNYDCSDCLTVALPVVGKADAREARLIRGEPKVRSSVQRAPESPSRRRHDGSEMRDGAANTCFGFLGDQRG